mmetsp:Transcript_62097/g.117669  ORF Transcript_62097/g.117669 Transcript_62097/m.117669 type:complete len:383 (-) Transcript_62097:80-1228(-)
MLATEWHLFLQRLQSDFLPRRRRVLRLHHEIGFDLQKRLGFPVSFEMVVSVGDLTKGKQFLEIFVIKLPFDQLQLRLFTNGGPAGNIRYGSLSFETRNQKTIAKRPACLTQRHHIVCTVDANLRSHIWVDGVDVSGKRVADDYKGNYGYLLREFGHGITLNSQAGTFEIEMFRVHHQKELKEHDIADLRKRASQAEVAIRLALPPYTRSPKSRQAVPVLYVRRGLRAAGILWVDLDMSRLALARNRQPALGLMQGECVEEEEEQCPISATTIETTSSLSSSQPSRSSHGTVVRPLVASLNKSGLLQGGARRLPSFGNVDHGCEGHIVCRQWLRGSCKKGRECHKCHGIHDEKDAKLGGGRKRQKQKKLREALKQCKSPDVSD